MAKEVSKEKDKYIDWLIDWLILKAEEVSGEEVWVHWGWRGSEPLPYHQA